MSTTGHEAFDRTLQTTHLWLNEIGEAVGSDKQLEYHALRAVLFALRDRLPVEEAFHLSAQLPLLIRGIFWENYRLADTPERYRSRDDFLEKVAQGLPQAELLDPEICARAVLGVLVKHIQPGEIEHVKQAMPEPVRELFP